ncbi:MAG: ribonuclease HI [Gammaproteobacteria bacterium]|nr:ribonuclease HI [Gammaproteobacteria bacterium]MCZ6722608.1 ribonuclease HI [Gammaproteobacteria bacterium]MCZ6796559.1 ribonuclease HI [Gammaproteobacteria bacterium]MCZ6882919.1 ribonuclease HI [Gammaproteobacteria bacterium]
MTNRVVMYTDGACRGNPGPGGWGVILSYASRQKTLSGFEPETTNNRMELTAAIEGLRALTRPCEVDLNTDSKYVLQGINEWIENWKANGWKTATKKPVKNADLWNLLDKQTLRHRVNWHWVKGHAGIEGNEEADRLANMAIDRVMDRL